MGKTIVVSNLKGGCGKSFTAASLSFGLAMKGAKVLAIDADPQGSLTVSFGIHEPDALQNTLESVMSSIITGTEHNPLSGIITHSEGADLLPANITLTGTELTLVSVLGRETILRQYIEKVKPLYDWIIIDTSPSLGLLTINALAAADSVLIPMIPKYLDAKGLELLLKTISQIRRQINPNLVINGILQTMVEKRAKSTRGIISLIENTYGNKIRIFGEHIPRSVRASESTEQGISIFAYEPNGKLASAYAALINKVVSYAA